MWKATFYAFLLLLALNGKQLTPSRLAHAVTSHGSWESNGKNTSPITCVPQPLTLTIPPSAPFAGYSVVQAQNAAQGENRYTNQRCEKSLGEAQELLLNVFLTPTCQQSCNFIISPNTFIHFYADSILHLP